MTREEAITLIKSALKTMYLPKSKEYISDLGYALEIAIKALEQEPCEGAISRQWLMACVNDGSIKFDTEKDENRFIHLVRDIAPPVTPQSTANTGHWIKYSIPRCGEQHYKCTSCGYYINFGQWGELYTKEFRYCPNCGCRMVEPQEREE